MKKILILIALLPLMASAYDAQIDGIYYNLDINTRQAEVTSLYSLYLEMYNGNAYTGSITIPETITYNGVIYSVTSIGEGAFKDCEGLKEVDIPNSVTSIGSAAFALCYGLTEVKIPNSVTSIGDWAFGGCYDRGTYTGLYSITIPSSVKSIGKSAFSGCNSLSSVHITDLEAWCNIDFGNRESNPLSNNWAIVFLNDEKITDLVIPDGLTSIKDWTFFGFDITSVTIPNSVKSIGKEAFYGCQALEAVNISDIEAWCKIKFSDAMSASLYHPLHLYLHGNEIKELVIPDGITAIEDYAFSGYDLTSLTIPNSVTSIGNSAFYNCPGLTSVIIPNSVTTIGEYAFYCCSGLTSVTIPNSVTNIGDRAFNDCNELTSISIGESVKTIGKSAFYCGTKVKDVYCYADDIPTTGDDVFVEPYMKYATLHVPATSVETYKATAPWSGFGNIVALKDFFRGDVNGDGEVNGTDIQNIINIILTDKYDENADINEDGDVNGTDIQEVINIILTTE